MTDAGHPESGRLRRALRWASGRPLPGLSVHLPVVTNRVRRQRIPGGRQICVQVKFTAGEFDAVVARSVAAGLTVPSYLALVGLRPDGIASADIRSALTNARAVRRVLSGVANNLNQLTARLHGTGEIDAALPAVLASTDAVLGANQRSDRLSGCDRYRPGPMKSGAAVRHERLLPRFGMSGHCRHSA